MTLKTNFAILSALAVSISFAQESATPIPSATTEESPAGSVSPAESGTPSATPEPTPSASPERSIRISFVPPPLDGKISLGIYDAKGKLVRVLHKESDVNEFQIGADALVAHWDGRNDNGEDLPAGKYHARGYLVGQLKVEDLTQAVASHPESSSNTSVKVKLTPNPLASDNRGIAELAASYDKDGTYLKTFDGLPLLSVTKSSNVSHVLITKNGDKSIDIWQSDDAGFHQFHISNVDQMMAFDCGEFELK
jgi:hypothetical protein